MTTAQNFYRTSVAVILHWTSPFSEILWILCFPKSQIESNQESILGTSNLFHFPSAHPIPPKKQILFPYIPPRPLIPCLPRHNDQMTPCPLPLYVEGFYPIVEVGWDQFSTWKYPFCIALKNFLRGINQMQYSTRMP